MQFKTEKLYEDCISAPKEYVFKIIRAHFKSSYII